MKIKQIDGGIERKQKLLSSAFEYVAMKALVATEEVLITTKNKNGKCHSLRYVTTKRSASPRRNVASPRRDVMSDHNTLWK